MKEICSVIKQWVKWKVCFCLKLEFLSLENVEFSYDFQVNIGMS